MKFKIIIIISISLFLTGCSKYEELNNLSIISNIEISYKEKNYIVTMQEIIPKKEDNKINYNYSYRTGSGENISKAFSSIIDHSPKKIYLKNVQNIIIKDNEKKKIIKDLIEYQIKNQNISKESSIIISNKSIKEIEKINSDYKYIDSILKNKRITLKETIKTHKKKMKLKIPSLIIKNDELVFNKFIYLQV